MVSLIERLERGQTCFENETLDGGDLSDFPFSQQVEFIGCSLNGVRIVGAKHANLLLSNSEFINSDFSLTSFDDIEMDDVIFRRSKLMGCGFSAAMVFRISLDDCILRYSQWYDLDLRDSRFHKCDLRESRIASCNIRGVTFNQCNFEKALLYDCNMTNTDFSSSRHVFVSNQSNVVKGTSINSESAIILASTLGFRVEL